MKKTPGLLLGVVAVALFATACSTTAATPAPPTETTAASPTAQTTEAPLPAEPTEAQTTEAPPQEASEPTAETPTQVDPSILPATIGEWKLDDYLVMYTRGHILDGDNEIATIQVFEPEIFELWKNSLEGVEDVVDGVCGTRHGQAMCVTPSSTYGTVLISGEGLEQAREIAEVVFPLV